MFRVDCPGSKKRNVIRFKKEYKFLGKGFMHFRFKHAIRSKHVSLFELFFKIFFIRRPGSLPSAACSACKVRGYAYFIHPSKNFAPARTPRPPLNGVMAGAIGMYPERGDTGRFGTAALLAFPRHAECRCITPSRPFATDILPYIL